MGKVAWNDLTNKEVLERALAENALGRSQTSEVAWLDFIKCPYVERDVAGFDPEESAMPALTPRERAVATAERIGVPEYQTDIFAI